MKNKIRLLSFIAFFVIFLITWVVLGLLFDTLEAPFKGMICALVSTLLTPRVQEYNTQSGKQLQIKWLFLKNAISIPNK